MADKESRKGLRYTSKDILDWVNNLHAPHDEALDRAFKAPAAKGMPEIQIGPSEGKLLYLMLKLIGARKVVEVGTLAGYSALWMARALPDDGRLWTLESEPSHAEVARENITAAGLDQIVAVVEGRATDVLPGLAQKGPFDAVFLDADKGGYAFYMEWAAENLRSGGLLMADNAFFFGGLLADEPDAASVRRMHENAGKTFDGVTIGTGDGMFLGIRR